MKLDKRALYLIFPVVLLSYLIAVTAIYYREKDSIIELEQKALSNHMEGLVTSFEHYNNFAKSYMYLFSQSEKLRIFLQEPDQSFKILTLGRSLKQAQQQLVLQHSNFISVAIIDENNNVLNYYETSADPFSEISSKQLEFANKLFAQQKSSKWQFFHESTDNKLIVQSKLIDTRTLTTPINSDINKAVVLQLAVEPSEFLKLSRVLEDKYQNRLFYTDNQLPHTAELFASTSLTPQKYINLQPNANYLADKFTNLHIRLLLVFLLMSAGSIAILIYLVRLYITQPITELEAELSSVMMQRKSNISIQSSGGEIASLANKIHSLYKQLSSSYQAAIEQSQTDSLTNLPNRMHFNNLTRTALKKIDNQTKPLIFMIISLDEFKYINDKFGHKIGDQLLEAIAFKLQRVISLSSNFKPTEAPVPARLGGDEFALFIQHLDNKALIKELTEKILKVFKGGFQFEQGRFPVTASIGACLAPNNGKTLTQLLANADAALHQAKINGKNQIAFYSESLAVEVRRVRDIENQLKLLDCNKEFHLVYMPICQSETQQITGCEVLLRWKSPVLADVGPDEFIPIAESCGLFSKIDHWVVENALADYAKLENIFGKNCKLSINLSAAELSNLDIVSYVKQRTKYHKIDPFNIELEITETYSIDEEQKVEGLLMNFRESGFKIAIDDFGTGYTSLLQMVEYPVDKIKLDKIFLERVLASKQNNILAPLIGLCHSQNMVVTAEGVETAEQAQFLKNAGCDLLQGYFIGKPMRIEQLKESYDSAPTMH